MPDLSHKRLAHPLHIDQHHGGHGGSPAPTTQWDHVIADLQAQADKMQSALDAVRVDIAALQSAPPAPGPAPTPTPAPQPVIAWPSFTGTARLVGTSPSGVVSVYVDASLPSQAVLNATDLLADADRIVALNNVIFGITQSTPVNVILFALGAQIDGTGGADHMACTFADGGNIEVDVSYGNSARCSALFEAELSECAMRGQLCGLSTGEALSRWCAMQASGNALADFASAPEWQQNGSVNWVDQVDPSDGNIDSTGCGMAFISFLIFLGSDLPAIAQAMVGLGDAGTLAELYSAVGMGASADAWPRFLTAVQRDGPITSDDPFGQGVNALKPVHRGVTRS